MKKLLVISFLLLSIGFSKAQSVDEVINRFIDGNGGKEKLNSIYSLQIQSTINIEQFGLTMSITSIKERNKLFRIQTSNPMSEGESFTVITDTAGYTYTPAINSPMGSMEASLTKFTEAELLASAYQKECDGFFAALVDYSIKGSTATYLGEEKVNGVDCDKIQLKLKTGQEIIYFISKVNAQVRRLKLSAIVAMDMMGMNAMTKAFGGNRMGDRKIDIDFEKYKLFNGIPFPTKQSLQLGMMQLVLENTTFKINEPIDAKWYLVK